jgi:D-alanine-D-alanine ligase
MSQPDQGQHAPRTRKPRIAVVFGGRSGEHAISCVTAGSVLQAIDRERYDVVPVGITRDGRWVLESDDPARLAISSRDKLPEVDGSRLPVTISNGSMGSEVLVHEPSAVPRTLGEVDAVFPVLHGPWGEDGTIQGLLEMAGVAYVGSGVLASAAAMDKAVAKVLLRAAGLRVAEGVVVRRGGAVDHAAVAALGLPVFVKPARGGSSIGISRVDDLADLDAALAVAHDADPKALVEAAVVGREVECGVLSGPAGPEASVPAEVRVSGDRAFYDFEAKYLEDATELDVPALLPDEVTARLRAMALRAFEVLDCEGLARVDFFVGPDGTLTVNEVNTMPGFTPTSMYPRMWAASGVDYPALVDRLVQAALARSTGLR